mgnify:FL=1
MSYKFNPFTGTLDDVGPNNGNGVPGGSTTQVQFNDGGVFGGDADLTWNKTTNVLGVTGDVNLDDGGTYTTTLQTITPTANRTISFPDSTGTVALVAGSSGQLLYNNAGANAGVPSSVVGATGNITLSLNGALSATGIAGVPVAVTGTWIASGGTATTTKPQVLIEPTGATSTAWSTGGTGLGVNAASGFVGRLLDLQINGTSNFNVDSTGRVSFPLATAALPAFYPGTDTNTGMWSPAADTLAWSTNGVESTRIDSSGRLLVGTSSARGVGQDLVPFPASAGDIALERAGIAGLNIISNRPDQIGAALRFGKSTGNAVGSNTIVANNNRLGTIQFCGADGTDMVSVGAQIEALVDGTPGANDMPGRLVFSTTADGSASPTERLRITSTGVLQVADAGNITVGTTTGTKIGTATTQKLGFFDKTPVVQPVAVADATDAATVITQLNALLARMRDLGLIAT